ncbi:uncharacterized protein LOC110990727 [Acanthaster planci]|uniref:Uncharacterized protein LOC110990727 n=1 Tax=Acanthaster planci TaxID=133434 RepID=A0A8B8A6A9_ACAPL|nr:uncharacterized protein LOC110990727 [Acanthaster planci]
MNTLIVFASCCLLLSLQAAGSPFGYDEIHSMSKKYTEKSEPETAWAIPVSDSSAPPPINVSVVTNYITTEVQTLAQEAEITFIGQLCEQSKGFEVEVTVLLNNNPDWDPSVGVLYYYVVDDPNKGSSAALCNNSPGGTPQANCTVKAWPSNGDIYIKGHAGQSEAVSFTLSVTMKQKAGIKPTPFFFDKSPFRNLERTPSANNPTVYLSQVVTLSSIQPLGYHKSALLAFTFCPTPQTGTRYEVQSATSATDGHSSYASYICDKLPCVVDGENVIAANGRQLPSNIVQTESGTWKTLYALIVGWGGVWNPPKDEYIGHFIFDAQTM